MSSFAHLGQLLAHHTTTAGLTAGDAAALADASTVTWQHFERTGTGLGPRRIGLVAEALGVTKGTLYRLADPRGVLGTLWSVDLGELIRERRGRETIGTLGGRAGVSSASITRWERALTRPRDIEQLNRLLDALGIDPLDALAHALWPPAAILIDRPRIGTALLERRTELGLSTRQAAVRLAVTPGGYNAWERGRTSPAVRYHTMIAEFLEIDPGRIDHMLAPEHVDTFGLDPTAKTLVKKRRATLERRDVTAARSGLSSAQVKSYESGRTRPPTTVFPRFAAAFGLDPFEAALLMAGTSRDRASFGQLLRAARTARGWRTADSAQRMGTNHNTLSYWENDRNLPVRDLARSRMIEAVVQTYGFEPAEITQALARTVTSTDPFGPWLQSKLDKASLSKGQVARQLATTRAMVSNWCQGRYRPGVRFVVPLAALLGTDEAEIRQQLELPRTGLAA